MYLSKIAAMFVALTGAAAANAQGAAADPTLKPGLWEVSIAEHAPSSTNMRTTTARVCHSADDVKVIARVVPPQHEFGMKCENRDIKTQGATVSWKVTCTGKEGSSTGAASMTLAADSYSGLAKLDTKTKGKAAKVEQSITGKWVSDCK